jgi:hypothetical protein
VIADLDQPGRTEVTRLADDERYASRVALIIASVSTEATPKRR